MDFFQTDNESDSDQAYGREIQRVVGSYRQPERSGQLSCSIQGFSNFDTSLMDEDDIPTKDTGLDVSVSDLTSSHCRLSDPDLNTSTRSIDTEERRTSRPEQRSIPKKKKTKSKRRKDVMRSKNNNSVNMMERVAKIERGEFFDDEGKPEDCIEISIDRRPSGWEVDKPFELIVTSQNVDMLLISALFYQKTQIIRLCKDALVQCNVQNALYYRFVAEKHELTGVLPYVVDYVRANFTVIVHTHSFLGLGLNHLQQLLCDDGLRVQDELEVFHAARAWIDHCKHARIKLVGEVMACVRFIYISPEDIVRHVEPHKNYFRGPGGREVLLSIYRYHALNGSQSDLHDLQAGLPPPRRYVPLGMEPMDPATSFQEQSQQLPLPNEPEDPSWQQSIPNGHPLVSQTSLRKAGSMSHRNSLSKQHPVPMESGEQYEATSPQSWQQSMANGHSLASQTTLRKAGSISQHSRVSQQHLAMGPSNQQLVTTPQSWQQSIANGHPPASQTSLQKAGSISQHSGVSQQHPVSMESEEQYEATSPQSWQQSIANGHPLASQTSLQKAGSISQHSRVSQQHPVSMESEEQYEATSPQSWQQSIANGHSLASQTSLQKAGSISQHSGDFQQHLAMGPSNQQLATTPQSWQQSIANGHSLASQTSLQKAGSISQHSGVSQQQRSFTTKPEEQYETPVPQFGASRASLSKAGSASQQFLFTTEPEEQQGTPVPQSRTSQASLKKTSSTSQRKNPDTSQTGAFPQPPQYLFTTESKGQHETAVPEIRVSKTGLQTACSSTRRKNSGMSQTGASPQPPNFTSVASISLKQLDGRTSWTSDEHSDHEQFVGNHSGQNVSQVNEGQAQECVQQQRSFTMQPDGHFGTVPSQSRQQSIQNCHQLASQDRVQQEGLFSRDRAVSDPTHTYRSPEQLKFMEKNRPSFSTISVRSAEAKRSQHQHTAETDPAYAAGPSAVRGETQEPLSEGSKEYFSDGHNGVMSHASTSQAVKVQSGSEEMCPSLSRSLPRSESSSNGPAQQQQSQPGHLSQKPSQLARKDNSHTFQTTVDPNHGSGGREDRNETTHLHGSAHRNETTHLHGSAHRNETTHLHGSAHRNETTHLHGSAQTHADLPFSDMRSGGSCRCTCSPDITEWLKQNHCPCHCAHSPTLTERSHDCCILAQELSEKQLDEIEERIKLRKKELEKKGLHESKTEHVEQCLPDMQARTSIRIRYCRSPQCSPMHSPKRISIIEHFDSVYEKSSKSHANRNDKNSSHSDHNQHNTDQPGTVSRKRSVTFKPPGGASNVCSPPSTKDTKLKNRLFRPQPNEQALSRGHHAYKDRSKSQKQQGQQKKRPNEKQQKQRLQSSKQPGHHQRASQSQYHHHQNKNDHFPQEDTSHHSLQLCQETQQVRDYNQQLFSTDCHNLQFSEQSFRKNFRSPSPVSQREAHFSQSPPRSEQGPGNNRSVPDPRHHSLQQQELAAQDPFHQLQQAGMQQPRPRKSLTVRRPAGHQAQEHRSLSPAGGEVQAESQQMPRRQSQAPPPASHATPRGDCYFNENAHNMQDGMFTEDYAQQDNQESPTGLNDERDYPSPNSSGFIYRQHPYKNHGAHQMSINAGDALVVVVGGLNPMLPHPEIPCRLMDAFDHSTNSWNLLGKLPEARHHHGCVMLDGYLYIIGGCLVQKNDLSDMSEATRSCYRYDFGGQFWTAIAPLRQSRMYHAVTVLNGIIYAIGGETSDHSMNVVNRDNCFLHTCEYYNPDSDEWGPIANLYDRTIGAAVTGFRGLLWVIGGFVEHHNDKVLLGSVECYDPRTNSWTHMSPLPTPLCHASVVNVMDTLFLVGGGIVTDPDQPVASCEDLLQYHEVDDVWVQFATLSIPRHDAACCSIDSRIYILGGIRSDSHEVLHQVECIDIATGQWISGLEPLSSPAIGMGCVAVLYECFE